MTENYTQSEILDPTEASALYWKIFDEMIPKIDGS